MGNRGYYIGDDLAGTDIQTNAPNFYVYDGGWKRLLREGDSISATNADTVDNLHAASFLRKDTNDSLGPGVRIGFNGSSITSGNGYGIGNGAAYNNLNSIAVDTLETDGGTGGGGTLELNYYGGNEVHIGSGGSKPLRAAIFYDGNTGYYVDPNSTSRLNAVTPNIIALTTGNSPNGGYNHYGIYEEPGAWTHPYPDLMIEYHTGIKYIAYYGYGGHRFYTGYQADGGPNTLAFSIGEGDHNVRVYNNLYVAGTAYANGQALCQANGTNCPAAGDFVPKNTWWGSTYTGSNGDIYLGFWSKWLSTDLSERATHRGEGTNFIDYSRYVYNNGAYSGSGWIEPSDLGVRYAASAGTAGNANACSNDGNCEMPGSGIWNSSGNVGIGTASPGAKLEVVGSIRLGGKNISSWTKCNWSGWYMTGSSRRINSCLSECPLWMLPSAGVAAYCSEGIITEFKYDCIFECSEIRI